MIWNVLRCPAVACLLCLAWMHPCFGEEPRTAETTAPGEEAPEPLWRLSPNYPAALSAIGAEATVRVRFDINEQGVVSREYVESSTDDRFNAAALDAIRRWRFKGGRKQGRPANFALVVPVQFKLEEDAPRSRPERGPALTLPPNLSGKWPQVAEGLKPDSSVRWGRLPNGLRYAIRQNAQPKDRMVFRLVAMVGGLHEEPGERGYAHFVEHMAFNGTRRNPGESLVRRLSIHGMAIGAEVSAFTFPTHTIYGFETASSDDNALNEMLGVLRDIGDGILFEPEQVERERGVIESEFRERDSEGRRRAQARALHLYWDNALGTSLETPSRPELRAATAERLQAFHRKWYTPGNMILVAVGDRDPETVERLVSEAFGDMMPRPVPAAPPVGHLTRSPSAVELYNTVYPGIGIEMVRCVPSQPDSLAERRRRVYEYAACGILQERLRRRALDHPNEIGHIAAVWNEWLDGMMTEGCLQASSRQDTWGLAVDILEQERRRMVEYPPHPAELTYASKSLLDVYEHWVSTVDTRPSEAWAQGLASCAIEGRAFIAIQDQLALVRAAMADLSPEGIRQVARACWTGEDLRLFAVGAPQPGFSRQAIADRWQAARKGPLQPPPPPVSGPFAYTDFGKPGTVKERRALPELGITSIAFRNGVRVNLKPVDWEKNTVALLARLGDGLSTAPDAGLARAACQTWLSGGLGRHKALELPFVLAGDTVRIGAQAGEREFVISGSSDRVGLERMLQLISAYITDPAWEERAMVRARDDLAGRLRGGEGEVEPMMYREIQYRMSGKDPRYLLPSPMQILSLDPATLRRAFEPVVRKGYLEVGIIGDFDLEEAVRIASRTLGATPRRGSPGKPARVKFPASVGRVPLQAPSAIHRAAVAFVWKLDRCDDLRRWRAFQLLSSIVSNRLREVLREDVGGAYSPQVDTWQSDTDPAHGYLFAQVAASPERLAPAVEAVQRIASTLEREGLGEPELQEAREPAVRQVPDQLRGLGYWSQHILLYIGSNPDRARWPGTRLSDLNSLTAAQMSAICREVFRPDRTSVFTATPGS